MGTGELFTLELMQAVGSLYISGILCFFPFLFFLFFRKTLAFCLRICETSIRQLMALHLPGALN